MERLMRLSREDFFLLNILELEHEAGNGPTPEQILYKATRDLTNFVSLDESLTDLEKKLAQLAFYYSARLAEIGIEIPEDPITEEDQEALENFGKCTLVLDAMINSLHTSINTRIDTDEYAHTTFDSFGDIFGCRGFCPGCLQVEGISLQ